MIALRDLRVTYRSGEREKRAVQGVSLDVERGSVVALAGESGSGKSTVLMAIPGLLPPGTAVSGAIDLDGQPIAGLPEDRLNALRWRRVAIVPQGAMNSFTPVLTVGRHVEEVLEVHLGLSKSEARRRIPALFALAGLDGGLARRYPHELSGGQKQRSAIALALACDPDYLLCDEPTTALDVVTQKEIVETLVRLVRDRGVGMLLVSHDLPMAASVADVLAVMKDGRIVERGDPKTVVSNPRNAHTRALVSALRALEEEP